MYFKLLISVSLIVLYATTVLSFQNYRRNPRYGPNALQSPEQIKLLQQLQALQNQEQLKLQQKADEVKNASPVPIPNANELLNQLQDTQDNLLYQPNPLHAAAENVRDWTDSSYYSNRDVMFPMIRRNSIRGSNLIAKPFAELLRPFGLNRIVTDTNKQLIRIGSDALNGVNEFGRGGGHAIADGLQGAGQFTDEGLAKFQEMASNGPGMLQQGLENSDALMNQVQPPLPLPIPEQPKKAEEPPK